MIELREMPPALVAGLLPAFAVYVLRAEPSLFETVVLPAPAGYAHGLTTDGTYLWNLDSTEDRIYRIDPDSGAIGVSHLPHRGNPRGLTWLDGRFWMAEIDDDQLIGFTTQPVTNGTLTTRYVSKGSYYHVVSNDLAVPLVDTHVYLAVPEQRPETQILSRRYDS